MTAPTKKDLAKMLSEMPYGPLLEIAKELVEMNQEPEFNRHPETPAGMAATLYDWGEAWAHE
ncbi:hypothetical protein [Bradyrhizobium sp. Leo121]|uniref:hypothetical protein n=1 Tax=Bradyrhizobium sp. Leo121 TaxID=1571195 RepID=UPI00102A657D|nr:hypothetical protein [Bradyrhizobium sp. Leo121]